MASCETGAASSWLRHDLPVASNFINPIRFAIPARLMLLSLGWHR
jgi:hypothetical protein